MRFNIKLLFRLIIVCLPFVSCNGSFAGRKAEDPQKDSIPALGFWPEEYDVDSLKVSNGETFTDLMQSLGLGVKDAMNLVHASDTVFDVKRMRSGCLVEAFYSRDTIDRKLEYMVYHNDRVRSTIFKCRDSLSAWIYDKPVVVKRVLCDVTIRTSLWNDMIESGTSPLMIVELADIYAWTINFFTLREGDRFRAIYNQKMCDGEVIAIQDIEFAMFDSGDFHAPAIFFDQGDGGNKYWNEKGESLRKAFLKAPLRYNRISSRFTYHRKHPVTGRVRPHTGVDYAAPTGTPVQSIGDGTVTLCGWDPSGGGNRIKIKHMNGYETCYMHLSKFAKGIKVGARVAQGQTIAYVGSTGTSTGPHLDFRVWKDRKPIDPLKMISPPSQPLNKDNMDSLKLMYSRFLEEIQQ